MSQCPKCGTQFDQAVGGGGCPRCMLAAARNFESPTQPVDGGQRIPPPKPAEIARLFPELEIIDLIGHGGMGFVYKARQKNLGREVAIKLLSTSLMNDPMFEERFSREARAMAMMNHPNIIAIYDFGQRGTYFYLVMELVDGLNLRQLVQTTKLQPIEAMQLVPQLCDALQYAHDRGIVHRDIKPENILISQDGQVKVADFGLAKLTGSAQNLTLTKTQQVMGTVNYMAPEQRERPAEVDHRADIYSLGVVIYELLTGELPLGRFAPPSKKVTVDVRLDEIVLRALEKDPTLRFQQASEFKTGVQSLSPEFGARYPVISVSNESNASKLGRFLYMGLALLFCISGGLFIVLSAFDLEFLTEDTARIIGFSLGAFGGFLFAMLGFYVSVFHPERAEKEERKEAQMEEYEKRRKDAINRQRSRTELILRGSGIFMFFVAALMFMAGTGFGGELLPQPAARFGAMSSALVGAFFFAISGMVSPIAHENEKSKP